MKIHDDHMYHGAALIQIAEHDQFTAINSLTVKKKTVPSAYKINDHIAVYLKYAAESHDPYDEYVFTFKSEHIQTIRAIAAGVDRMVIALVCVEDREVCAITADELSVMISERQKAHGGPEDQYTLLVTAEKGKSLRAYMNKPGVKGKSLKRRIISRNAFPNIVFG
jgi:hypothetical protein